MLSWRILVGLTFVNVCEILSWDAYAACIKIWNDIYIVVIYCQLLLYYIGVQLLVCISLCGICILSAFIGHLIIYKIYLYSCIELSIDWIIKYIAAVRCSPSVHFVYTLCISASLYEMLNCLGSDTAIKSCKQID